MEEKLAGPHSSHKFGVRRIAIPLESASCVCLLGVPGACECVSAALIAMDTGALEGGLARQCAWLGPVPGTLGGQQHLM